MRALILAAGLGERLRPLTLHKAKPAIEFLNLPMLAFPYYWLSHYKLDDVIFNTHHLPQTVRAAAMHVADPAIRLHFTHEDMILGSGGGIWNGRVHLQGDTNFAVANGDGVVLCEEDDVMEQMLAFHEKRDALATLLVCPLEGVGTRIPGVWMENNGEVLNFGKAASYPHLSCFHYASFMILSERIWKRLPEGSSNIIYDVLEPAIADGEKVYGFRVDQMQWFETGNIEDYLNATKTCLEYMNSGHRLGRCAQRLLDKYAPYTKLESEHGRLTLRDTTAEVDPSARLNGFQVLGRGSRIEAGAMVEDSVLLPESRLGSQETVVRSVKV